ncbi:hypothetical protein [Salana multivorans]
MRFDPPLTGWFTHVAWNIDLSLSGPFVRTSVERRRCADLLARLATELVADGNTDTAQALEVTVIPPIKGGPRYDLALLVRARESLADHVTERAAALGLPTPIYKLVARNAGIFGDTDGQDGEILLNHFAGESGNGAAAVAAWKSVSAWYMDKLGVDNSTLLRFEDDAPFLIMNYARIPGRVPPFLLGQLARPSFYRVVRHQLHEVGLTPFPLFARRVTA